MNGVAARARGRAPLQPRPPAARRGRARRRAAAPALRRAGRGRSAGRSSGSAAPARLPRQKASCAGERAAGEPLRCQTAKSAYWTAAGERRGLARPRAPVERRQLAHQDAERPAVGDDVVDGAGQQVAPPARGGAARRAAAARARGRTGGAASARSSRAGLRRRAARGERREVDQRQRHRRGRQRAAAPARRRAARRRCAAPRGARRSPPRRAARAARSSAPCEAQRARHVVGGAPGSQPVEEPEPLLGEGERRVAAGRRRGTIGGSRASRARRPPARPLRRAPATVGCLEQAPERQLDPAAPRAPGPGPRREQRMPAEVEEASPRPTAAGSQQLGPDRRPAAPRPAPRGASSRSRRGAPAAAGLRAASACAVDLAVRR